jgi:hypothetical protein
LRQQEEYLQLVRQHRLVPLLVQHLQQVQELSFSAQVCRP